MAENHWLDDRPASISDKHAAQGGQKVRVRIPGGISDSIELDDFSAWYRQRTVPKLA
jgi:hypothetical protein